MRRLCRCVHSWFRGITKNNFLCANFCLKTQAKSILNDLQASSVCWRNRKSQCPKNP